MTTSRLSTVQRLRPFVRPGSLANWGPLLLISGLSLFFELAVIRWLSGEMRLFAYFKNLTLLAAFLGLAIGFALAGRQRDYRSSFSALLLAFTGATLVIGRRVSPGLMVYPGSGEEALWFAVPVSTWLTRGVFLAIVLVAFLITMLLFIPLGQATGKEMKEHAPVPAYIANLLGSLAGIWAFSFLSYLQTPPAIWFGVGILGYGAFMLIRQKLSLPMAAVFGIVLVGLAILGKGQIWSPYQRLDVSETFLDRKSDGKPVRVGYGLTVNQAFYQYAVDLSSQFVAEIPQLDELAVTYNLPYRLKPEGAGVLVLGAGMGNDVAAALRNGAARVDAVDIDPAILELGGKLHPERPYDDPRVSAVVDDARSFLKRNTQVYDVISFGLLDSHTLISGLSNVRLDSFVYTVESFREVRNHLADEGVAAVTFAVVEPWIEQRLGRILAEVFGPDKVFVHYGSWGTTFVAGSLRPDQLLEAQLAAWRPNPALSGIPLSTDDWPYLYMRERKTPAIYWQVLLLIAIVCLGIIARSFPEALHPDWHFWLLGAAFLLIEFKSITELALLFGTTWFVNALAISGVLLMALAANLIVIRRPKINLRLMYGLLFASLALAYFFPLQALAALESFPRAMASMVLLSLPLFFAGLIFSESLRRAGEAAGPLASNLSGSVAGGVLEYASLWWGIKSLYIIATIIYAGALLVFLRRRRT